MVAEEQPETGYREPGHGEADSDDQWVIESPNEKVLSDISEL